MAFFLQHVALTAAFVLFVGYIFYQKLLPKPMPGIPYNKTSARRLLGDVPDALAHLAETQEVISFLTKRCIELNSPVVQVFMRPFSKPWVVLVDGRESDFFRDLFISLFSRVQGCLPTNDQWRFNRKLMADAMRPDFLNSVAAQEVYEHTLHLIGLWKEKARLAQGRAFDASEDSLICTVDTIWAATFGLSLEASKSWAKQLANIKGIDLPVNGAEELAKIPEPRLPEMFNHIKIITQSSEIVLTSPLGRRHHWFAVNFYPLLRRAIRARDKLVNARIEQAWKLHENGPESGDEARVKCALDLIVERETTLAKKDGREPDHHSRVLFDELCGFLSAGSDTTSTTVNWGLKYLTKHQDVQARLRKSLKRSHRQAWDDGRLPSAEDIGKTDCPYLALLMVEQTVGPSMLSPGFPIDEAKRTASSRDFKGDADRWNERKDMGLFDPSRWLTIDENGNESFDRRAAPLQTFGAGPRGCFGKRFAYLEMREIYTLIIWHFELLPLPATLEDFKAKEILAHNPRNVRVRLAPLQATR
ncbi:hypothetical protein CBER1_00480 [Cercospora berteroae]|uniref:Cytochrome P450 monooxygenase n=1 Tax=Cercospora berteroae TaxID=357750 RepID=A0A2S6CBK6_9PEZI|nr:hypothetical protein CBER1_00480 [Cercospora berteroae]